MKTIPVVVWYAICYALSLQVAEGAQHVAIGVRGGVFSSSVVGSESTFSKSWFNPLPKLFKLSVNVQDIEPQSGAAISGGLYVEVPVAHDWYVQGELLYQPERLLYEREITIGDNGYWLVPGKLKLDGQCTYVNVPLLVKKVFPISGDLDPYLYAGPTVGFLIDNSIEGRVFSLDPDDRGTAFATGFETSSVVAGACIGGGVYIRSREKTKFGLDFRYAVGLTTAVRSMTIEGSRSHDLDLRFRSFGVSLLVMHRL